MEEKAGEVRSTKWNDVKRKVLSLITLLKSGGPTFHLTISTF